MFVITHSVELTVRGQWTKSNVRLVNITPLKLGANQPLIQLSPYAALILKKKSSAILFEEKVRNSMSVSKFNR